MSWQPNMSRWYDENYDIKEPLWRTLLELASHHGDTKKLQQILSWFNKRNMHGDYYKVVLIGSFLKKEGVSLDEHIGTPSLSVIADITKAGNTIDEYAINLLKREHVDEEFIEEFRTQFAEQNVVHHDDPL